MRALERAVVMLGAGLLVAVGLPGWWAPRGVVTLTLPADATDAEVARRTDEAKVLWQARQLGWDRTDPVVSRHLIDSVRFLGEEGDDGTLLARAWQLGLAAHDPLVRGRLLDRAQRAARTALAPTDAALGRHLRVHADRFRSPDAWAVVVALGEPPSADAEGTWLTLPRLATLHGGAVADAVDGVVPPAQVGPVPTARGVTWVAVRERREGTLPPLDAVRTRVEEDWRETHAPDLATLAASVPVNVQTHRAPRYTP